MKKTARVSAGKTKQQRKLSDESREAIRNRVPGVHVFLLAVEKGWGTRQAIHEAVTQDISAYPLGLVLNTAALTTKAFREFSYFCDVYPLGQRVRLKGKSKHAPHGTVILVFDGRAPRPARILYNDEGYGAVA